MSSSGGTDLSEILSPIWGDFSIRFPHISI